MPRHSKRLRVASGTLYHTFLLSRREEPLSWGRWSVQLNAGSSVLESYQCDKYCADAEGSLGKVDMFIDNDDPLKEETNDAVQEESLWEGVCQSCALHTKILGSNRAKIGMSRGRSSLIKFFVTMDEKY